MKGSTARKILKVYRVVGIALGVIVAGGGIITLLSLAFVTNWVAACWFVGGVLLLILIVVVGIEADVSKHDPD